MFDSVVVGSVTSTFDIQVQLGAMCGKSIFKHFLVPILVMSLEWKKNNGRVKPSCYLVTLPNAALANRTSIHLSISSLNHDILTWIDVTAY